MHLQSSHSGVYSVGMLNSIYFHNRCPFCNNRLIISDVTSPARRSCVAVDRHGVCLSTVAPVVPKLTLAVGLQELCVCMASDSGKDAA